MHTFTVFTCFSEIIGRRSTRRVKSHLAAATSCLIETEQHIYFESSSLAAGFRFCSLFDADKPRQAHGRKTHPSPQT